MEPAGRLTAGDPRALAWLAAVRRGLRRRCPACGQGRVFARFLKVVDACSVCSVPLHHHRADDLPPYLVIVVVSHIIGAGILITELNSALPLWVHMAVWPTLTVILSLLLLEPIKGAVVGLQYALGMHGFGDEDPGGSSPAKETWRDGIDRSDACGAAHGGGA